MRESSPEICFAVLAGGPLPSKKRKDGISARIDTLERAAPNARRLVDAARADLPRPSVAMDDILDALVLCVSAARIVVDGASGGIPEEADFDDVGLPMQMLYPPAEPPEAP
jgi:predicted RNase H-like nuclease